MHGGSHGVTLASHCYAACHSITTPAAIVPAGHPREYLPHRHPRGPLLRRQQPCAHRPLHLPGRLPPMLLQQGAHCGLLAGQRSMQGRGRLRLQATVGSCSTCSNSTTGSSSAPRTGRIPEADRVRSWNPVEMLPCEPGSGHNVVCACWRCRALSTPPARSYTPTPWTFATTVPAGTCAPTPPCPRLRRLLSSKCSTGRHTLPACLVASRERLTSPIPILHRNSHHAAIVPLLQWPEPPQLRPFHHVSAHPSQLRCGGLGHRWLHPRHLLLCVDLQDVCVLGTSRDQPQLWAEPRQCGRLQDSKRGHNTAVACWPQCHRLRPTAGPRKQLPVPQQNASALPGIDGRLLCLQVWRLA